MLVDCIDNFANDLVLLGFALKQTFPLAGENDQVRPAA